jgi:phenylacetate-coenzyme A ligase PaaK-like adenylate-forming protein
MQIRSCAYQLLLSITSRGRQQSFFKNLRQAEGASVSEIGQLQDRLLSQLLQHAYSQVPYYRRVLDELGGLQFIDSAKPKNDAE